MDEIVTEFLVESNEGLDRLDQDFVELEKHPDDQALLANIFRCIHTIKGTCGFLGFEKLERVTHVGENLLSRLRDGELRLTPESTSALLAMVDAVREIMGHIAEDGASEGDGDYGQLVERLASLATDDAEPPASSKPLEEPDRSGGATAPASGATHSEARAISAPKPAPEASVPTDRATAEPSERETSASIAPDTDDGPEHRGKGAIADASIRVDVGLLDKLMNLVGELVLARNQVLQYSTTNSDSTLSATTQRLNLITTELQEGVMKTRMQPIGNVWSKFPRVVRDLSVSVDKRVRVEMEGRETELDKTLIEAIKDPLTHIVRNAVDHGIEHPDERIAAGKDPEARLELRAFHEGGQVNIEISDDGRGIDPDVIREKALERGLVTRDEVSRLSERDVNNLLFLAGFSTARRVTNISGRGVGMDVVRSNIEKIGGTVDLQSTKGLGTTLRIKIPLTLAIIPALIVRTGGDRFALPQASLLELVRLEGETARSGIEYVRQAPVYRLRGRLLPLVDLNDTLRLPGEAATGVDDEPVVNIVVLQADDQVFGLVVDEILDTEEIVVKPLGKQLKNLDAYAGATIMGDGAVALILDVIGLAHRANVASSTRQIQSRDSSVVEARPKSDRKTMLLFSAGGRRQVAIPLSDVSRLEEFPASAVERAGHSEVMQYRGRILPLVRLSRVLGLETDRQEETVHVVVYQCGDASVGLVVDEIIDIVEDQYQVHRCNSHSGIVGSVVIQEKVTDILDVPQAIELSGVDLFEDAASSVGA